MKSSRIIAALIAATLVSQSGMAMSPTAKRNLAIGLGASAVVVAAGVVATCLATNVCDSAAAATPEAQGPVYGPETKEEQDKRVKAEADKAQKALDKAQKKNDEKLVALDLATKAKPAAPTSPKARAGAALDLAASAPSSAPDVEKAAKEFQAAKAAAIMSVEKLTFVTGSTKSTVRRLVDTTTNVELLKEVAKADKAGLKAIAAKEKAAVPAAAQAK